MLSLAVRQPADEGSHVTFTKINQYVH